MTIRHIELLSVRADDGLATAAELAELEAAGLEPTAWHPIRALVVEGLSPPQPVPRRLTGDVLRALELSDGDTGLGELDDLLAAVLCPPQTPALAADVLAALALDTADDDLLDEALQAALAADGAPALADDVLAALGLTDASPSLQAAVQDALAPAGSVELADAVLRQLALDEDTLEIGDALRGEEPSLAEGVLERLGLQEAASLSGQVAAALRPDHTPALADDVLGALGLADALAEDVLVRAALQDDAAAPDLWAGIAAEIGAEPGVGALLREAVAAQAGTVDLVDAVMAEIGAAAPAAAASAGAEVVPLRPAGDQGLWTAAFGGLLAAAAAVMLFLLPGWMGTDSVQPEVEAFAVAEVDNTADIESLEAGPDALVQFFQSEEGAPTIIFINEMDEPEPTSGQDDGVPL